MDHDDIRIFVSEAAEKPQAEEDLDTLAAETEALRESGNLDTAKRLGRELASLSAQSPELTALAQSFGFALNPARERQLQVLMVFSGQHALRAQLTQLLSEAAVTAMNNYLINYAKPFWDTISDGSAFTQYLLVAPMHKATQAQAVGDAFARMCGQEDNTDLHRLGSTLFATAAELVKARWEEAAVR